MTSESNATKATASRSGIQCLSRLTRTLDSTLRAAVHATSPPSDGRGRGMSLSAWRHLDLTYPAPLQKRINDRQRCPQK